MKQLFLAALKSELKRKGVTQRDISNKITKSPEQVSRWLNNGTSLKNLDEIMVSFSITLSDLKKYW